MKRFSLLFTILLTALHGKAQPHLEDSVVYVIESKEGVAECVQREITLEVAGWTYDTCNRVLPSFAVSVRLKNATEHRLICNRTVVCWNDTDGVHDARQLSGDPQFIEPGKTGTVRIDMIPYTRRNMNRSGMFLVLAEGHELLIPLKIRSVAVQVPCSAAD